jgi:16S rRNA (cytidine1402-2'-O)-methyltransferase
LGDLSSRATETLRAVAAVVAEDTRRTRALLSHLGVRGKAVIRLDAHGSEKTLARLVDRLTSGESMAVVTDAGTSSVSDPGAALVRGAAAAGVDVAVIPGASAVTAAIALSGLVEGPFLFVGFLPRKGEKRRKWLERIAATGEAVILFEAPHRTAETLRDLAALAPDRLACVAREMTKLHEETLRGSVSELARMDREYRGEVTIVLGPSDREGPEESIDVERLVMQRLQSGASAKDIATELATLTGQPRRALYALAVELSQRARQGS